MTELTSQLTLTPIVILSFCLGILILGTIIFLILTINTHNKLHLATFFLGLAGSLFIGNEISVLICGYEKLYLLGMKFHRIQALSVASFSFVIPFFVFNMLEMKPIIKNFTRALFVIGIGIFIIMVVVADISPDLFISQTIKRTDTLLSNGWNVARGKNGIIYNLRDLYLGFLIVYTIILLIYELIFSDNRGFLLYTLTGLIIAAFTAVYDLISVRLSFQFLFFHDHNFSFFSVGITIFIFFSMLAIMRQFIYQSREVERTDRIRYLGLFAGGIAHDFNNLLAAIIGNVSMLKGKNKNNDILEILSEIDEASFRAKGLTQQLLTFSKGGVPIKEVVSIKNVIKKTAEFVLSGTNHQVKVKINDNLLNVYADKGQIEQVLQNILLNSRQILNKNGEITITAENYILQNKSKKMFNNKNFIKIIISDNGDGISRNNKNKIFEPYFTTKEGGTGLGLAISYSIIKRHDGTIKVISKKGFGTSFEILIPATEENVVIKGIKKISNMKKSGTVLLMDDEEMILKMGRKMLTNMGFEVDSVRSGQEAIKLYKERYDINKGYDFVIFDLTIPGGMGGEEAVAEIKKIDPFIKAIVSTGYSNDPVVSDYKKYGFSGIANKPYTMEELARVIDEVL